MISDSDKYKNSSAKGCTRRVNTECRYVIRVNICWLCVDRGCLVRGVEPIRSYLILLLRHSRLRGTRNYIGGVLLSAYSPSQGPCCNAATCKFLPSHTKNVCKSETDCSLQSVCNGSSAECPSPPAKENKTRCNEGTQVSR